MLLYAGAFVAMLVLLCILITAYVLISDRRRTAEQRRINPEYRWHAYQPGLDMMRRYAIDGSLQYRAMTDEEYRHHIMDQW